MLMDIIVFVLKADVVLMLPVILWTVANEREVGEIVFINGRPFIKKES